MKQLVEFQTEDGNTILFEVETGKKNSGFVDIDNKADNVIVKATHSLDSAMDKIRPGAEAIVKKLKKLHEPPEEIDVSFGIKVSAEAGAFIASGSVDCNYTVTLKWKKPPVALK